MGRNGVPRLRARRENARGGKSANAAAPPPQNTQQRMAATRPETAADPLKTLGVDLIENRTIHQQSGTLGQATAIEVEIAATFETLLICSESQLASAYRLLTQVPRRIVYCVLFFEGVSLAPRLLPCSQINAFTG